MTPTELDRWLLNKARRPLLMGVLNVTPDSFSDGGRFWDVSSAVAHAHEMAAAGAAILDVGGESTRPGSQPVCPDEQIRRVVPVIGRLRDQVPAIISIDTGSAAVAKAAIDAGASMVNDIYAGRNDPALLPLVAQTAIPVILMHMKGRPDTMQLGPVYEDVVGDVIQFLAQRINAAVAAGVDGSRILVDPGIGFGKTAEHNLQLLRRLSEFKRLGKALVVGPSRKSFLGKITGEEMAEARVMGTAAAVAWSLANGADLLRVHDVEAMSQVTRVIEAIQSGRADLPQFP